MVSQSSTYSNSDNPEKTFGPEKAIDGYENSQAHTKCGEGAGIWYKINLGREFNVGEVKFRNYFIDNDNESRKMRMGGTRIFVINNDNEELCETLHVPADDTRQIYSINCGDKIGDGVILRGKEGNMNACIHISEIKVFGRIYTGNYDDNYDIVLLIRQNRPANGTMSRLRPGS